MGALWYFPGPHSNPKGKQPIEEYSTSSPLWILAVLNPIKLRAEGALKEGLKRMSFQFRFINFWTFDWIIHIYLTAHKTSSRLSVYPTLFCESCGRLTLFQLQRCSNSTESFVVSSSSTRSVKWWPWFHGRQTTARVLWFS